jgi:hypothetical protein
MKCYCCETESEFLFCVEEVDEKYIENVEAAWFKRYEDKFLKIYPKTVADKELIKKNFERLGESMFLNSGHWKNALLTFAKKCSENKIKWYITGSVSEAVLGVDINPHDIDIVTHEEDFYKVKDVFSDFLVEPFVDNNGTWVVRYFGRLCVEGVMIDVVADEKRNEENHYYEPVQWNGYTLKVEPLQVRYEIELQRNRIDRIQAINKYLEKTK